MSRVLILAFGNPLRSDDGVAWHAARALEGKFPESAVGIVCLHQLAPELAETVSRAERVIFVDAATAGNDNAGSVQAKEIHADDASSSRSASFSHSFSPSGLLGLALHLYGAAPRAFCVTMTGSRFDHGESLSPAVAAALPDFISRLELLIQSALG